MVNLHAQVIVNLSIVLEKDISVVMLADKLQMQKFLVHHLSWLNQMKQSLTLRVVKQTILYSSELEIILLWALTNLMNVCADSKLTKIIIVDEGLVEIIDRMAQLGDGFEALLVDKILTLQAFLVENVIFYEPDFIRAMHSLLTNTQAIVQAQVEEPASGDDVSDNSIDAAEKFKLINFWVASLQRLIVADQTELEMGGVADTQFHEAVQPGLV